jgi:hypothetical protein
MGFLRLEGWVLRLKGEDQRDKVEIRRLDVRRILGLFSSAPCPGSVWCSERRRRFRDVFQVLGSFP